MILRIVFSAYSILSTIGTSMRGSSLSVTPSPAYRHSRTIFDSRKLSLNRSIVARTGCVLFSIYLLMNRTRSCIFSLHMRIDWPVCTAICFLSILIAFSISFAFYSLKSLKDVNLTTSAASSLFYAKAPAALSGCSCDQIYAS